MSSTITRKPVPSAPMAPAVAPAILPAYHAPTQKASDSDLSKDLEKDIEKDISRVSTEYVEPALPQRPHGYGPTGPFAKLKSLVGLGPGATYAQGQKKFFGLSKKKFLICLILLIVAILALAIGLGVGLSKHSRAQNLPLPSNKQVQTGDLTYYAPGLGACGITNSDSDSIVAVSHLVFDAVQTGSNPNANPLCGKKIRASRYNEKAGAQRSVDLTVTDRCVGCKATDIDVTTSVFDQLADRDAGRVVTTWAWLDVDM